MLELTLMLSTQMCISNKKKKNNDEEKAATIWDLSERLKNKVYLSIFVYITAA